MMVYYRIVPYLFLIFLFHIYLMSELRKDKILLGAELGNNHFLPKSQMVGKKLGNGLSIN